MNRYIVKTTSGLLSHHAVGTARTEHDARELAQAFSKSDHNAWTWGVYLANHPDDILLATYHAGKELPSCQAPNTNANAAARKKPEADTASATLVSSPYSKKR